MARKDFHYEGDSLERIERLLAIEDALIEKIRNDNSLSSAQRDKLISEVETRAETGDFPDGDDWDDDDALATPVRKPSPKGPLGQLGAVVRPESEPKDAFDSITPTYPMPESNDPTEHSGGATL